MLLKEPTWRWDYVRQLIDDNEDPIRQDDRRTKRAHGFLKKYIDAEKRELRKLEHSFPDYSGAIEINERLDLGFKWYLEAAIMSDMSVADIAREMNLPAGVVRSYEELFFDIRDYLDKPDYIVSMVFFPSYRSGIHGRDFDTLWKMMAYYGSFDIVRDLNSPSAMSNETKAWVEAAVRSQMAKNALVAAQVLTPNQYNANEIIGTYVELLRLESSDDKPTTALSASLADLFGSIELAVSNRNTEFNEHEPRAIPMVVGNE